jgi:hypothetical protein
MPQLPGDKPSVQAPLYGPPKPPRTGAGLAPPIKDKAEIRSALHNWQLGLLSGDTRRSVGDGKPAGRITMVVYPLLPEKKKFAFHMKIKSFFVLFVLIKIKKFNKLFNIFTQL